MSFGIKPIGERAVLKKLEAEEKTSGGIILTSAAREKPQVAEVIAVGKGESDIEVKPGDKVVFAPYAGTEISFEGETYTIMDFKDLLAVVG